MPHDLTQPMTCKHSGSVQGQMNEIFFKLLDRWMLFMSLCTKHDMFYSLHCAATVQQWCPAMVSSFRMPTEFGRTANTARSHSWIASWTTARSIQVKMWTLHFVASTEVLLTLDAWLQQKHLQFWKESDVGTRLLQSNQHWIIMLKSIELDCKFQTAFSD